MDERDKIIREDYPVDRLPEDLREGLGGVERVRVTVERSSSTWIPSTWSEVESAIEALHATPGFKAASDREITERSRTFREDWD